MEYKYFKKSNNNFIGGTEMYIPKNPRTELFRFKPPERLQPKLLKNHPSILLKPEPPSEIHPSLLKPNPPLENPPLLQFKETNFNDFIKILSSKSKPPLQNHLPKPPSEIHPSLLKPNPPLENPPLLQYEIFNKIKLLFINKNNSIKNIIKILLKFTPDISSSFLKENDEFFIRQNKKKFIDILCGLPLNIKLLFLKKKYNGIIGIIESLDKLLHSVLSKKNKIELNKLLDKIFNIMYNNPIKEFSYIEIELLLSNFISTYII